MTKVDDRSIEFARMLIRMDDDEREFVAAMIEAMLMDDRGHHAKESCLNAIREAQKVVPHRPEIGVNARRRLLDA